MTYKLNEYVSRKLAIKYCIYDLNLGVAIDANTDIGNNEIIISIDADNKYNELSETNNTVQKSIFIYANGITPVFPYNYSIIGNASQSLIASTSDALAPEGSYVMEMDTTTLFNSSSKVSKTIKSVGGAISFEPGISYSNGRVYYWRVSPVPATGEEYRWANSSFQYLAPVGSKSLEGAGQGHLYQNEQSLFDGIQLDSTSRQYSFRDIIYALNIPHAVIGASNVGTSNFGLRINNKGISSYYCTSMGNSLMFNVLTPTGLKPYFNQSTPSIDQTVPNSGIGGFMGSVAACKTSPYSYDTHPESYPNVNKYNFQFKYQTKEDRDKVASFMQWIPDNSYVAIRLFITPPFDAVPLVNDWKLDGLGGNTLYQQFIDAGLTSIDDFTTPGIGVFIYKKSDNSFIPIQKLTDNTTALLQVVENVTGKDSLGFITSPKFGPAREWKTVEWSGRSVESISTDHASVDVLGVTSGGDTTRLYTLDGNTRTLDISGVDASKYPYVQLRMRNVDSINFTPFQLDYWRVLYSPVPEGALAGNIALETQDSLNLGDDLNFAIAFKNVSNQVYSDSIKATVTLRDTSNNLYTIPIQRLKPLAPGDTAMLRFTIPGYYEQYNIGKPQANQLSVGTSILAGMNSMSIALNPDNNPLEQTLENNNLSQRFYVKSTSVPVDFGDVKAVLLSDHLVHVSWQALNSIGSDYYIVERSSDGKTFTEVSRQQSLGDGSLKYSAMDNIQSLSGQPSSVYYRIVGVDKTGHSYYSNIVSIHPIWSTWSFSVAPNPIYQDKIQLILTSKESSSVQVRLMDMSGRVLLQRTQAPDNGGHMTINTPHLSAGIYMIEVVQGGNRGVAKVIRK